MPVDNPARAARARVRKRAADRTLEPRNARPGAIPMHSRHPRPNGLAGWGLTAGNGHSGGESRPPRSGALGRFGSPEWTNCPLPGPLPRLAGFPLDDQLGAAVAARSLTPGNEAKADRPRRCRSVRTLPTPFERALVRAAEEQEARIVRTRQRQVAALRRFIREVGRV